MSKMVELNLNPDTQTLRQFGFIALGGFALLGLLAHTERLVFAFGLGDAREAIAYTLFAVGIVSALLSLVAPRANRLLFVGLSVLSFPIGFVMSYVILGSLFFLVIAPVAIVFRLLGRDSMGRGYDKTATSYWSKVRADRGKDSYFKQY